MSGVEEKEYKERLIFASACRGDDEYNSDTTAIVLIPSNMFCECSGGGGNGCYPQEIPHELYSVRYW